MIFTRHLVERGFAVYVENAHSPRWQEHLLNNGWTQVNEHVGPMFLYNYDGKIERIEP